LKIPTSNLRQLPIKAGKQDHVEKRERDTQESGKNIAKERGSTCNFVVTKTF